MKTITIKRNEEVSIVVQERKNEITGEVFVDVRKWAVSDLNGKLRLRPTGRGLLLTHGEFEQMRRGGE